MIFPSYEFLYLFLPAVLLTWAVLPRAAKPGALLLFSMLFYGWADARFLILVSASIAIDYLCGRAIGRARSRGTRGRPWLTLSVLTNLGALAWFKYANFGVATFNNAVAAMDFAPLEWSEVILPIGISFYTFQSMSYTIDVFRGEVPATRNPVAFASYVTMFPQLVAGPIVRWRDMEDQIHRPQRRWSWVTAGVLFFQLGLAKKVLLADSLDPLADASFALDSPSTGAAWLGAAAYTLQLYFDFSGYSDMAIGLGLMLGYRFPINFDRPYTSASITEFWRRWHISLSTWLRDYLYIPLGGNRKGKLLTYKNLMITMLLGGLWHGTAWTFVLWGAWHGGLLALERSQRNRGYWRYCPAMLRRLGTLLLVMLGWVLFRAETLGGAGAHLLAMFGSAGHGEVALRPLSAIALISGTLLVFLAPTSQRLVNRRPLWLGLAVPLIFALTLLQLHYAKLVTFLYFRF